MRTAPILAALWLASCASVPRDDPRQNAEALEPLLCRDQAQCSLYWQRAHVWVSKNSTYRIQLSNETVIETYGPFGSKVDMAYQILKEPDGNGGARITIAAACDNFIRCYPTRTDAIVAFKRFVRTGN